MQVEIPYMYVHYVGNYMIRSCKIRSYVFYTYTTSCSRDEEVRLGPKGSKSISSHNFRNIWRN